MATAVKRPQAKAGGKWLPDLTPGNATAPAPDPIAACSALESGEFEGPLLVGSATPASAMGVDTAVVRLICRRAVQPGNAQLSPSRTCFCPSKGDPGQAFNALHEVSPGQRLSSGHVRRPRTSPGIGPGIAPGACKSLGQGQGRSITAGAEIAVRKSALIVVFPLETASRPP